MYDCICVSTIRLVPLVGFFPDSTRGVPPNWVPMTGSIYFSVLVPASNMVPGSAGVIHNKGWLYYDRT
jgi:hypothetical protein